MEKEEIAQLVASAVGAAMAQITPVITGLKSEIEELKKKPSNEEGNEEDDDDRYLDAIKNYANASNLTKENGYNIQEV